LTVKEGDELTATVVEVGGPSGGVVLKRVFGGRGAEGSAELEAAFAHGLPVEGTVTGVNKGGVEVSIGGVRAFCPISQLDLRHTEDAGAFVDLGGVEGMLHVSELGFQRVAHPKDLLSVGQEVEVQILKIEKSEDPKKGERIALSLKSLEKDPWSDVATRFYEGARANGVVKRLETFGAFVEVAPGVEGLLHVSELGRGRPLRHARDATKVGAALDVVVLALDSDKRRLSLGLAEAGEASDATPGEAPRAPKSLGTFADLLKGKKK